MKTRVLVDCSWTDSATITKRLLDQFYIDQDLSSIEFVYDGECDFNFQFGYERGPIPIGCKKKYIFSMEPSWSGNFPKNRSTTDIVVYAQSKETMSSPKNVIEFPTYMFYGSGGEGWTYNSVVVQPHIKTKNISCIASQLRNVYNHPKCLYNDRRSLVMGLMASNAPVDVFSWPKEIFPKALDLPYKIQGLSPYKFSVAIENTHEQNYITEKFYDPILTNTIPIYFGATNIKEIYPENGYFVIEDITDTVSIINLIKHIEENADKLYEQMLPEVQKIKQRYLTEFNLLTKILELAHD